MPRMVETRVSDGQTDRHMTTSVWTYGTIFKFMFPTCLIFFSWNLSTLGWVYKTLFRAALSTAINRRQLISPLAATAKGCCTVVVHLPKGGRQCHFLRQPLSDHGLLQGPDGLVSTN